MTADLAAEYGLSRAVAKGLVEQDLILPLLDGRGDDSFAWEERTVISDSQRIQTPRKWKGSSVMTGKWRLVMGTELYHVGDDPAQTNDVAAKHPKVVAELRALYPPFWESVDGRWYWRFLACHQPGSGLH